MTWTSAQRNACVARAIGGLALLLTIPATPAGAAPKIVSKECIACHAPVQKQASKEFVHTPFKDEKGCESFPKRQGVVGALDLKEEEPGLCLSRHKKEEKAACTSCHDPHSSAGKELLRAVVHAPTTDCSSCRAKPEAGKGLALASSQPGLCFQCHEEPRYADPTTTHDA